MQVTYTLIITGFILILVGLSIGLKNIDPKKFVAIAGTIGIIITGFGIFGKFFQDEKSGQKQNEILNNTINNLEKSAETIKAVSENLSVTNVIRTKTEKIDSTTTKSNELNLLADKNIFPRLVEPLRPRGCVSRPANLRQQHKYLISRTLRVIFNW